MSGGERFWCGRFWWDGEIGLECLWDGGQGRGSGLRASPGEQDERGVVQGRFGAGGKNRDIGKQVADVFWKQNRQEDGFAGVVDLV